MITSVTSEMCENAQLETERALQSYEKTSAANDMILLYMIMVRVLKNEHFNEEDSRRQTPHLCKYYQDSTYTVIIY